LRLRGDGSLDPDFAYGESPGSGDFYSLAIGQDGKIYYGTLTALGRLNPDGTSDGSFAPAAFYGPYGALAIQPDGKVIVGQYGDGPDYSSMRRLLPDGTEDPAWTVPVIDGGDHVFYAIALQPDGKVLVGGNTIYGMGGMRVASLGRLHTDGTVDTTFDTHPELYYYSVEDLALAPDGKVYVAGHHSAWPDLGPGPGIWRLNNDPGLQPQLDIRFAAGEGVRLVVSGYAGARYRLEYRDGISATGFWTLLTTLTLPGPTATYQDTAWAGASMRIYRAVSVP